MRKFAKRTVSFIVAVVVLLLTSFGPYQKVAHAAEVVVGYSAYEVLMTLAALCGVTATGIAVGDSEALEEVYNFMSTYEDVRGSSYKGEDLYAAVDFMKMCQAGSITLTMEYLDIVKTWAEGLFERKQNAEMMGDFVTTAGMVASANYNQSLWLNGREYNSAIIESTGMQNICGYQKEGSIHMSVFGLYEDQKATYPQYADSLKHALYLDGVRQVAYKAMNGTLSWNGASYKYASYSNYSVDSKYLSGMVHSFPIFGDLDAMHEYLVTGRATGDYTGANMGDNAFSDYTTVAGVNGIWDRDHSLENYDVISAGSTIRDGVIEGDRVFDVVGEKTWEEVIAGEKDWVDVMTEAGAIAIDKTKDTVVDDDKDSSNDKPIKDVLPDITHAGKYLPKGLGKVFPFCIPYDFVYAIQVLTAKAEAPVFEVPFKVKAFGIDTKWKVDMSQFDGLVRIFRVMETLGFIVALIVVTRNLIKG